MKKSQLLLLSTLCFAISLVTQAQQSTLVYPGSDGKLIYTPHANNGETIDNNILPDFSYAGYMDGGVKVPVGEIPVKLTLYPTASGEDRTRIQAAINQVCNMTPDAQGYRGSVLLKRGTYRLNDGTIPNLTDGYGTALRIWASGVVLRGEGQGVDGTILYSDFATNHTMITIEPVSKGLSTSNTQLITDAYVGTGARTFAIANASGFAVGDLVIVRFTPNDTWFSDLKVTTGGYITDPADYWTVTGEREAYNIGFKRKITAINGNSITIECPLVQPLQTKYGGGTISKYSTSGRLVKCAVEDLRIVGIEDGGSPTVSTNGNRLRVGIRPRYTDNSWIHGVTVTRASESAVMTWDVMNVTVQECAYIDPRGAISGGWRYSFCLDAQSTRVLFQRCYSDYGRHDFVTHARIPGPNVFLDCVSEHGLNLLGPHHRWATGTLFDNIKSNATMAITEYATSSAGHAFCGAQTVGWNLECGAYICDAAKGSQNYLIGSIGNEAHGANSHDKYPESIFRGYWEKSGPSGVHVATRSLYLKQLEDRLGATALENITVPDQLSGNIYAKLSAWAGEDLYYSKNISVVNMEVLPKETTVIKGYTKQLIAAFTPWNASNKKVTWTSNNTSVATVSAAGLITPIALGTATIYATSHDGGIIANSEIIVTAAPINKIISNCDSNAGWTSSNTLTLNTADKKQGLACLQSAGTSTDEFKNVFSPAINTGVSVQTDALQFWYFVSDVSLFTVNNQVELGSGGKADTNEYSWNIGTLTNGWNLINLPFSSAAVLGTPDLGAINWFRLYHAKTGNVTTRIDAIQITNLTSVRDLNSIESGIYIYPNPDGNFLNIKLSNNYTKSLYVSIADLSGKMLINKKISIDEVASFQLNTSHLNSGLYIVKVTSDSKSVTRKFFVNN